jgi:two-component system, LuxR family, response regulator FixJ
VKREGFPLERNQERYSSEFVDLNAQRAATGKFIGKAASQSISMNHSTRPQGPICIVDDDDWVCDSLGVLLTAYGFAVRCFTSGAEFLADDRRSAACCLIIDQHMPDVDGLSVLTELARQNVIIPTILITARLDREIEQRADELGVIEILEKPFPTTRLLGVVEHACGTQ